VAECLCVCWLRLGCVRWLHARSRLQLWHVAERSEYSLLVLTYGTVMLMHVARLAMNMPLTHGACVHACQHAGMRHAKGPRAVLYARAVHVCNGNAVHGESWSMRCG